MAHYHYMFTKNMVNTLFLKSGTFPYKVVQHVFHFIDPFHRHNILKLFEILDTIITAWIILNDLVNRDIKRKNHTTLEIEAHINFCHMFCITLLMSRQRYKHTWFRSQNFTKCKFGIIHFPISLSLYLAIATYKMWCLLNLFMTWLRGK